MRLQNAFYDLFLEIEFRKPSFQSSFTYSPYVNVRRILKNLFCPHLFCNFYHFKTRAGRNEGRKLLIDQPKDLKL